MNKDEDFILHGLASAIAIMYCPIVSAVMSACMGSGQPFLLHHNRKRIVRNRNMDLVGSILHSYYDGLARAHK